MITEKKTCRICNSTNLQKYLDLSAQPLANDFQEDRLTTDTYPLQVNRCAACGHSQLSHVIDVHTLYDNYLYISGVPKAFKTHCFELAKKLNNLVELNSHDLIADIASNDGTFLSEFRDASRNMFHYIGVEPAKNLISLNPPFIDIFNDFFNPRVVSDIYAKYKQKAKVITAQNVFAHIDNLHLFVENVKELLHEEGMFVVEVPYLRELLRKRQFDTVYHEHLSYFLIKPLVKLFDLHKLKIADVELFENMHGGTIRLYVIHQESSQLFEKRFTSSSTDDYILIEELDGLYNPFDRTEYFYFNPTVNMLMQDFFKYITTIGEREKVKLGIFGASAKGTVFLNKLFDGRRSDNDLFAYCYDENKLKWGKDIPGTNITIKDPQEISTDRITHLLITTWNFREEIIKRCKEQYGFEGKFITAIPYLRVQ